MTQKPAPVTVKERIVVLDVLRGFALFGILMVNMVWFNTPLASLISDHDFWARTSDKVTLFFIHFLFEGKFYVLFSMLFGYGFWLFMNKTMPEGRSVLRLFSLRIFLLMLFGIAHVILLWPGDILFFYALFGFVLILFRKTSDKNLIRWAIAILLIPIVLMSLLLLLTQHPEFREAMEQGMHEQELFFTNLIQQASVIYPQGSFSELIQMRLMEYSLVLSGFLFFQITIIALFLVGQYAARKGYLANIEMHLPFFRKLCKAGFLIGIPANLFYAWAMLNYNVYDASPISVATMLITAFGGPALTLAYVSGIILLIHNGFFQRLAGWLAAVGRMALTNYLMHSILASFMFYSCGLGWYGQMSPLQGMIPVFLIFGLQIPFSVFWLNRFYFGPFEWLWRSLTYRSLQPFKRRSETA